MLGQAGWKRPGSRILLFLIVSASVALPPFWRGGRKAVLALMVVSSVAVVGYLPSTITASPGAGPATAQRDHDPLSYAADPLVSAEAVASLMSDCTSCHDMEPESITTKPFPKIPHKTEGWGQCGFCHAPARLAPPPESHTDIPDVLCRACHQVSSTPPPSLGHVLWRDKTCSSCHRTALALPASHADRGDLTCALCHEPAKVEPPLVPHTVSTDGLCSRCHTQGEMAPAEPRHVDWEKSDCATCHDADPAGVPTVPHAIDSRTECSFCHIVGASGQRAGLPSD